MITNLQVRPLRPAELPAAGAVVGRALLNSPVLLKLFPENPAKRAGALGEVYAVMLHQAATRGMVFGAFDGNDLAGACAITEPGADALSAFEQMAVSKAVSRYTSFGVARAFKKWRAEIMRRQPERPHWRLDAIAVEPSFQRRGVGAALMNAAAQVISANRDPVFLATDMNQSVPFLERYGFRDLLQAAIHGVTHKFLLRPPV